MKAKHMKIIHFKRKSLAFKLLCIITTLALVGLMIPHGLRAFATQENPDNFIVENQQTTDKSDDATDKSDDATNQSKEIVPEQGQADTTVLPDSEKTEYLPNNHEKDIQENTNNRLDQPEQHSIQASALTDSDNNTNTETNFTFNISAEDAKFYIQGWNPYGSMDPGNPETTDAWNDPILPNIYDETGSYIDFNSSKTYFTVQQNSKGSNVLKYFYVSDETGYEDVEYNATPQIEGKTATWLFSIDDGLTWNQIDVDQKIPFSNQPYKFKLATYVTPNFQITVKSDVVGEHGNFKVYYTNYVDGTDDLSKDFTRIHKDTNINKLGTFSAVDSMYTMEEANNSLIYQIVDKSSGKYNEAIIEPEYFKYWTPVWYLNGTKVTDSTSYFEDKENVFELKYENNISMDVSLDSSAEELGASFDVDYSTVNIPETEDISQSAISNFNDTNLKKDFRLDFNSSYYEVMDNGVFRYIYADDSAHYNVPYIYPKHIDGYKSVWYINGEKADSQVFEPISYELVLTYVPDVVEHKVELVPECIGDADGSFFSDHGEILHEIYVKDGTTFGIEYKDNHDAVITFSDGNVVQVVAANGSVLTSLAFSGELPISTDDSSFKATFEISNTVDLYGLVYDAATVEKTGIENVDVTFYNEQGANAVETFTDENGYYIFRYLPKGQPGTLVFEKDGFVTEIAKVSSEQMEKTCVVNMGLDYAINFVMDGNEGHQIFDWVYYVNGIEKDHGSEVQFTEKIALGMEISLTAKGQIKLLQTDDENTYEELITPVAKENFEFENLFINGEQITTESPFIVKELKDINAQVSYKQKVSPTPTPTPDPQPQPQPGADTTPNESQNISAGSNAQTGDENLALAISVLTLFATLAGVYFVRKKFCK